jgi:hypothetical protein
MKNNIGSNVISKCDIFGAPMPSFNYRGASTIGTPFGCILSLFLLTLLSLYGTIKFNHLVTKKNPVLSKAAQSNRYQTEEDALDLDTR